MKPLAGSVQEEPELENQPFELRLQEIRFFDSFTEESLA
jgi:hypothetical protein